VDGGPQKLVDSGMPLYEDAYPPERGPYPIKNYTSKEVLSPKSVASPIDVHMDQGAFRRAWEILEADSRFRYPTRDSLASVRAQLRAVEAFRDAYHGPLPKDEAKKSPGMTIAVPEPAATVEKRTFKKKVAAPTESVAELSTKPRSKVFKRRR
jgi:hypothetical protein